MTQPTAGRCEVSERVDDGPWTPCPRPGRPVWHLDTDTPDAPAIVEEVLCEVHARLMYACQECGEPKGHWRGQRCARCQREGPSGLAAG